MNSANTRGQFIKQHILSLFLAFILPIIIANVVLICISSVRDYADMQRRMRQSLNLAVDNIDTVLGDTRIISQYIESTNMIALNRMMTNQKMDYTDSLVANQFTAFIRLMTNSRSYIDSIFCYIENPDRWVYSTISNFSYAYAISDTGWIDILLSSTETKWLMVRSKKDYPFEPPRNVLSTFNRFPSYKGGNVVNYDLAYLSRLCDSITYFPDQSIVVIDEKGNILITTTNADETVRQAIASRRGHPPSGSFPERKQSHFIISESYPLNNLEIYTLLPYSRFLRTILENSRNNIIILFILLVLTFAFSYVLSLRSFRQLDMEKNYLQVQLSEQKYKKQVAELQALQYQINPHFLYNTLQSISYEILGKSRGHHTKANKMIEDLSDVIRYSLGMHDSLVPLNREAENCKKYIAIQQIRYENSFTVDWNIDNELQDFPILKLILQPFIENSITHGFKNIKRGGKIKIRAALRKDSVLFWVADNGLGINAEKLEGIRKQMELQDVDYSSSHVGLVNCNSRLALEYSPESTIEIFSKEQQGTIIMFKIRTYKKLDQQPHPEW